MKVTQIVNTVGKGGQAFGQIAYYLNHEFVKSGLETALITGHVMDLPDKKTELHLIAPNIINRRRETPNFLAERLMNLFAEPAFHLLSKLYIKKHKNELGIIINHDFGLGGDLVIIHGCIRQEITLRWQSHDLIFLINPLFYYRFALEKLKYGLKKFEKAIAVSNRMKQAIMDYYKIPTEDIIVIRNGIDIERFHPDNSLIFRNEVREAHRIPLDAPLLLFVAHNFWLKGLKFIIEALPKIKNAYLLVVGSGLKQPFETLADKLGVKHRVIFVGSAREVKKFYATSDLFVFPYESWALVCIEALASGIPVLATQVGHGDDYLRDGYNGFFIKRDHDDIATKANMILSDEELKIELGKNARKTAEEFSWDKIAKEYIELFEEL